MYTPETYTLNKEYQSVDYNHKSREERHQLMLATDYTPGFHGFPVLPDAQRYINQFHDWPDFSSMCVVKCRYRHILAEGKIEVAACVGAWQFNYTLVVKYMTPLEIYK